MVRTSLKTIVLTVICTAFVACSGPRVTYQGGEVDDTEVRILAQAAHIAELTWIHVFHTAEKRYMTGQLSDADWQVFYNLAEDMVHNLNAVQSSLKAYLDTPPDMAGTGQARRIEARLTLVALQATVQKALAHAANTLGEAYK